MDYPANAGKNEKQPVHTGNDFGTKPAHAVNFMKVAQSNHSLLIQGLRGKLRQVSFEDEPKVHHLQDEWSNPSEDEGIASTMREMMALIQKISNKLGPSIQPAGPATPELPGRFSSVHT